MNIFLLCHLCSPTMVQKLSSAMLNREDVETTGPLRYPELLKCDDEQLMGELQSGNADAFAVVFDRYHRLVLVTALRTLQDAGEAEDLTQTIFLEIYRTAARFDPARGTLKMWVLQFAYNKSISRRNYLSVRQFYSQARLDDMADNYPGWNLLHRPPSQRFPPLISQML